MFLSNDSLQDPLHAGIYWLVIISVTAVHVRLVIFPRYLLFCQKLSCSKQKSKKHAVCKQNDIRIEGSNKSKSKQFHYPRKFIPRKLQILAIFGDPRNVIHSKIPFRYSIRYGSHCAIITGIDQRVIYANVRSPI